MRHILTLVSAAMVAAPAVFAQVPPDQLEAFFNRVPKFGEPAREAARQEALRQQYQEEAGRSRLNRSRVQAEAEVNRSQSVLDKWGDPDTHYQSGGYETRSYHRGDTIHTIRTQDGVITDYSTYETK
jgi:hypothetical protein